MSSSAIMPANASTATASPFGVRSAGLCTFWLGGRQYGIDVSLVGEVVALGDVLFVPASPSHVLGLFTLRGTPITLLDLADVLGIQSSSGPPATALVVRTADVLLAFGVDRMEAVVPPGRSESMLAVPDDHPAVTGLVVLESGVVNVLDERMLLERIERLRLTKEGGAP